MKAVVVSPSGEVPRAVARHAEAPHALPGLPGHRGRRAYPLAWGTGERADDEAAIAAIRRAVAGGVNWVDAAASYGLGHSEGVVRRALEPWRVGEEVLVFTECGHPWQGPDVTTDGRPESIREECEGSLRRLGVDRLDLQLHHPDPKVPVEESWGAIVELVAAGKVLWGGLSNVSVEQLDRCEAVAHVTSIQPELNLLRRRLRRTWCRGRRRRGRRCSPTRRSPAAS